MDPLASERPTADRAGPVPPSLGGRLAAWWRRRTLQRDGIAAAYGRLMTQARHPDFYRRLKVPDTLDGRFDLLALHLFLLFHRLRAEGGICRPWMRALLELVMDEFDTCVRELGVGDPGVGRRVQAMAFGINGRFAAYHQGVTAAGDGGAALEAALENNLYGTVPTPGAAAIADMTAYIGAAIAALARQPTVRLLAGEIDFPPPIAPPTGEAAADAP